MLRNDDQVLRNEAAVTAPPNGIASTYPIWLRFNRNVPARLPDGEIWPTCGPRTALSLGLSQIESKLSMFCRHLLPGRRLPPLNGNVPAPV